MNRTEIIEKALKKMDLWKIADTLAGGDRVQILYHEKQPFPGAPFPGVEISGQIDEYIERVTIKKGV